MQEIEEFVLRTVQSKSLRMKLQGLCSEVSFLQAKDEKCYN